MTSPVKLNHRQQQVLWATVQHYVATVKPVGSEALVEEFNLNVSSATVRNAMGKLEKAGLLFQPHTSAGRVPSDSGYRTYVDNLILPSEVAARYADQVFSEQLTWERCSLEALLRGAAQILSTLSGYITLITFPQAQTTALHHLQLVPIAPDRAMLVVVLDCYETQSVLIQLQNCSPDAQETQEADWLERELQIVSNFLNQHLRGRLLSEIATLDWSELGRDFDRYGALLKDALLALSNRRHTPVSTQLMISGVAEVMRRHPEFSEVQQVQMMMQLLEEEQDQLSSLMLTPLTSETKSGNKVTVRIGAENPLKPISTCTLVSAVYRRGEDAIGSVGMIGPTRMKYENAIALVEATSDYLSESMSQF